MRETEPEKTAGDEKISKYIRVLSRLDYVAEIFEKHPEKRVMNDDTEASHFGIPEAELKHLLFYKLGYRLPDQNEKVWKILSEIHENLKALVPTEVPSFWAIPNLFCISHSHEARDVFRIEETAQSIASCAFDSIIELRNKEREPSNKYNTLFNQITKQLDKEVAMDINIIPDSISLDIKEINWLVSKIDKNIERGKKLLLHSQGRIDRLALILACWLLKHNLADETNFIDAIHKLREGYEVQPESEEVAAKQSIKDRVYNSDNSRLIVPFLFSKVQIREIKYWNYARKEPYYDVDEDILEIIRYFKNSNQ